MAVRPDYVTGTITLISGSVDFTTVGSALESADVRSGDQILLPAKGAFVLIEEITGENSGKLSDPCPAIAAGAGQNLRIRFQSDGQRYAATAQGLMEKLNSGNVEALAGLVGAFEKIAMFTAPGAMELIDRADLTAGVNFDERVDTLAGRAAYDANVKGFRVLVSNIGDGRAALYVKKSNTLADWSVASYLTGPVGPPPNVSVAPVETLAPGDPATVSNVGTPTAPQFKFGIPAGRGFYNKGTYAAGTAYVKDDVVAYNGSSYIAKQSTTGNVPTDPAYWDLLAKKGLDGTGQGDIVGPSVAAESSLVVFDGTTGKLVKDSGTGTTFLAVDAIATAKAAARGVYFPSKFADGFGGGGGVNTPTSSNFILDPANGRIIPDRGTMVAIPGATGSNIGNMTANGGLAVAFDGVASKTQSACASSNPSAQSGWIGKNYSTARRIAAMGIIGSSDFGFDNASAAATITINLRAKMTAPANGADGFLLATTSLADAAGATASLFSGDTATAWNYVWAETASTTLSYMVTALLSFSEVGPPLAMQVDTVPAATMASPVSASGKMLIRANEVIALSTDVKVFLSRNGGATWFAATLNQIDTLGPNALIDIASTAFSGAAGTQLALRFQTPTAKNVEFHGYLLEWK